MIKNLLELDAHPTRALLPVFRAMDELGLDNIACLKGTGIAPGDLADPRAKMTVQQELRFYRNVLTLTNQPSIGLQIGALFQPQSYGMFGYALFSAATLRHALSFTRQFGRLTFSFFSFDFGVHAGDAWFSEYNPPNVEPELMNFYFDRDISAAWTDFAAILGHALPLKRVHLPHDGQGKRSDYENHFDCTVDFGMQDARLIFDAATLDEALPQADLDSSNHLRQQSQMLIGQLSARGSFIDEIRMLILERPGYFPDIECIAERTGISESTLRRRLKAEGYNYRQLVDEARFTLAKEYLGTTDLPLAEVSRLLGYSEPANFTHAFRRWSELAPSRWRSDHKHQKNIA